MIYPIPEGDDGSKSYLMEKLESCAIFCCTSSDRNLKRNMSREAVQRAWMGILKFKKME